MIFCDNTRCKYRKPSKVKFWLSRKSYRCMYKGHIGLVLPMKDACDTDYGDETVLCTKFEEGEIRPD